MKNKTKPDFDLSKIRVISEDGNFRSAEVLDSNGKNIPCTSISVIADLETGKFRAILNIPDVKVDMVIDVVAKVDGAPEIMAEHIWADWAAFQSKEEYPLEKSLAMFIRRAALYYIRNHK